MAARGSWHVEMAALAPPRRVSFAPRFRRLARSLVRRSGLGLAVALALFTSTASVGAEEDATLPAPALSLTVTPGTGGGPWKLRIENAGDLPVRIAADARLLVLDVTPPDGADSDAKARAPAKRSKEPVTVRCVLPEDARPSTDEGRELVVPAKRSWSTTLDPLFYCFSLRERGALVAGATVKARFGWPAPLTKAATAPAPTRGRPSATPPAPPFAAAPVGAAVGKLAPMKTLEAASFTLVETAGAPSAASLPLLPVLPAAEPAEGRPTSSEPLTVSLQEAVDVARGGEISANVTVANEGTRPATLLLRGETIRFAVSGPAGSVACGSTRTVRSPIRELYATLGPKARSTLPVLVTAKCAFDTFDEPGIYRVTAILDTTGASARAIGMKTWDGESTSRTPMLLRVRTPRRPRVQAARPSLD